MTTEIKELVKRLRAQGRKNYGLYADAADALEAMAGEVERLKALLPAEMEGRAILFEACPVGHGNLRGENWVKHDCVICERDRLKAALGDLQADLQNTKQERNAAMRSVVEWMARTETAEKESRKLNAALHQIIEGALGGAA